MLEKIGVEQGFGWRLKKKSKNLHQPAPRYHHAEGECGVAGLIGNN